MTERELKKKQDRAMQELYEVRQEVLRESLRLTKIPAEEATAFQTGARQAYEAWYVSLKKGMHEIDPGFDD